MDRKRQRRVVMKFALGDMMKKEAEIYQQLKPGEGIPLIFGQRMRDPSQYGFICLEEFTHDLFQFMNTRGTMSLELACLITRRIVS